MTEEDRKCGSHSKMVRDGIDKQHFLGTRIAAHPRVDRTAADSSLCETACHMPDVDRPGPSKGVSNGGDPGW